METSKMMIAFRVQYLAFEPGVVDHHRPELVPRVIAQLRGITATLEHPMFTNRPHRARPLLTKDGASLN